MENNNKDLIIKYLVDNIVYYRKKMVFIQLELVDKLNYLDKLIFKWERGEGVLDIFVIKELFVFFGISVDQLIFKRK